MKDVKQVENKMLLSLEVYHEFPEDHETWDNLVEATNAGIYLTYDWCQAWWEYYRFNRELRIFMVYAPETHQLVGVMPMFIDNIRIGFKKIRLAKTLGSDFTIGTIQPPILSEWIETAFKSIINKLAMEDSCDAILIGPMIQTESVVLIKECVRSMNGLVKSVDIPSIRPHTLFELPGSFDDYMMSIGKSTKKNYKERWNRLRKRYEVSEEVITEPVNGKEYLKLFIKMHTEQWSYENKLGHFGDWPYAIQFHQDLANRQAKKDRFRLIQISASNKAISYQYGYVFGKTMYWLLPARIIGEDWDRLALGRISLVRMFAWAINNGFTQIDAGPGHYPYKLMLGAKELNRQSILLLRNDLGSRWRCFNFLMQCKLLNLFFYKLWFSRIAPKIGIKRALWKPWIRRQLT